MLSLSSNSVEDMEAKASYTTCDFVLVSFNTPVTLYSPISPMSITWPIASLLPKSFLAALLVSTTELGSTRANSLFPFSNSSSNILTKEGST